MSGRRSLLRRGLGGDSDELDPLGFLVNLFDVALVFALALMIALVSNLKLGDLLTTRDFTIVKNPGAADMEIITREAGKVTRHVASDRPSQGRQGRRVGTAYELDTGEIIYIPDPEAASEAPAKLPVGPGNPAKP